MKHYEVCNAVMEIVKKTECCDMENLFNGDDSLEFKEFIKCLKGCAVRMSDLTNYYTAKIVWDGIKKYQK